MLRATVIVAVGLLFAAGLGRAEAAGAKRHAVAAEQPFAVEQLRQAIHRHLVQRFEGRVAELEVRIVEPQQASRLPPGAVTARVQGDGPEDSLGLRQFSVALAVDGKPVRTVLVTAEVEAQTEAVAPVRLIRKDDILEADDLMVTRVTLSEGVPDLVRQLDEAVGKRATRALPPQQPLKVSVLAAPYAVRKGDRVIIEAKRGGLTIRTTGLTKSGGVVGQSVMVTNLDSGKQVQATVIAPGIVQVEF